MTVVPAQITTVEDKVAGNLGLSQLLLLVTPIFGSSILFVLLPPFFASAPYKLVIIVTLAVLCSTLAIRIKGRILLSWVVILLRYNLRPRYYLFNKNSSHLRAMPVKKTPPKKTPATKPKKKPMQLPQLSVAEIAQLEHLITNPQANLHFKTTKKGELRAYITEVK